MPTAPFLSLSDTDAPILPDWPEQACVVLPDEDATDALAGRLAAALKPGQTLLLSGHLGAGKTHLARGIIRTMIGDGAEGHPVPSPTFTLVQTYTTPRGEIWHADLYRLAEGSELVELGLDDALDAAICLIEWPDRLAPNWPDGAVLLDLQRLSDDARTARLLARDATTLAAVMSP